MTTTFTPAAVAIFAKQVLAHVATLDSEGGPHVTPVWVELVDGLIVINTSLGRAKARNLANDPRVAVSLTDPDNAYACVAVRGTVVGFSTDDADATIDRLAKKYLGLDTYPYRRDDEVRVNVTIRPDHILVQPS